MAHRQASQWARSPLILATRHRQSSARPIPILCTPLGSQRPYVWHRAYRHNSSGVDLSQNTAVSRYSRHPHMTNHRLGRIIMCLDMVEVTRIFERGNIPVQLAQPQVNRWVAITDGAQVALEVPEINRIEAHLWS